jgi:hypothetical protein
MILRALALVLALPAHAGDLPNSHLTPGMSVPTQTRSVICTQRTRTVRNVSARTHVLAFAHYHITCPRKCGRLYELDHLIPLELGGSNAIANLWPQSYITRPYNAHVKDVLENRLHALVCARALPLATAQREIAKDWISALRVYGPHNGRTRPARAHGTRATQSAIPLPSPHENVSCAACGALHVPCP